MVVVRYGAKYYATNRLTLAAEPETTQSPRSGDAPMRVRGRGTPLNARFQAPLEAGATQERTL